MKKHWLILILIVALVACVQEQKEEKTSGEMKMATDSELALLMRSIHEDAKLWKADLLAGKTPQDSLEIYDDLVSSTPTKAEVKGPVFEGFAQLYQSRLDSMFNAGQLDLAQDAYNNLISSCIDCHAEYCPGPIPTIKKLYIADSN